MTFADDHAPPSRPIGEEIPIGMRRAFLEIVTQYGLSKTEVWDMLRLQFGWGDWMDAGTDFKGRYGSDAQDYYDRFHQIEGEKRGRRFVPPHRAESEPALLSVPLPFFLTAIELSLSQLRDEAIRERTYFSTDPRDQINTILTKRGVGLPAR